MYMFQWLNTLDSREIYSQVLSHLPELQLLTSDNFQVCTQQWTHSNILSTRHPIMHPNFLSPEEASQSSLVGEFYIWRPKPRLQQVQEVTSFPTKWPHTGTCLSVGLSFLTCVCSAECVSLKVSRVDCISDSALCQSLYIHKPCVAVFKGRGIHDFEIHHGEYLLPFYLSMLYFGSMYGTHIWFRLKCLNKYGMCQTFVFPIELE